MRSFRGAWIGHIIKIIKIIIGPTHIRTYLTYQLHAPLAAATSWAMAKAQSQMLPHRAKERVGGWDWW